MTDEKALTRAAFQALKAGDFTNARTLYRRLLEVRPNGPVHSLTEAEKGEQLQFRQSLAERHPDVRAAQLAGVYLLLNDPDETWATHAVDACTKILQASSLSPQDLGMVRWNRLRASVRSGQYATLAEDFAIVWQAGETLQGAFAQRHDVIEVLSQINNPTAIPVLENILQTMDLPDLIQEFFKTKIHELRILVRTAQEFTIKMTSIVNGETRVI